LPPELSAGVKIAEVPHTFAKQNLQETNSFYHKGGYTPRGARALEIEFTGVGKVIVGNSKSYGALYNDVHVEIYGKLADGAAVKAMHQMLTVLGFGPVVGMQRPEDSERMKMAQIFRIHFPRQAIKFETNKKFYEMPIEDYRSAIEAKVPQMKKIFKHYLEDHPELMQKEEIYSGKTIWADTQLSSRMREAGSYGLMSGVGGSTARAAAVSVCLMIKNGALSSQDRFEAGLFKQGASSSDDLASGGGDQVFTRNVNKSLIRKKINNFALSGRMQILYDLDVVNRGSYGFTGDRYGVRNPKKFSYRHYKNRSNLVNLTKRTHSFNNENEIMVKNRIPPEFIRCVVVRNEEEKKILIAELRKSGLITQDNGHESILGKPIDEFVVISKKFSPKMWEKPKNS